MQKTAKIAVLVSGGGTNLGALIKAQGTVIKSGKITLVISNKEDAYALIRAKEAGIKTAVVLKKDYKDAFEDKLIETIKAEEIDIIVLATENNFTEKAVEIIKKLNIKGVWNFSDVKLDLNIPVKNIWIDDSLMTLCFEISREDQK